MSTNSIDEFEVGVWYFTLDYKDLYRIEEDGPVFYRVVSFGTWEEKFCFPGVLGAKQYMSVNCISHESMKENWGEIK